MDLRQYNFSDRKTLDTVPTAPAVVFTPPLMSDDIRGWPAQAEDAFSTDLFRQEAFSSAMLTARNAMAAAAQQMAQVNLQTKAQEYKEMKRRRRLEIQQMKAEAQRLRMEAKKIKAEEKNRRMMRFELERARKQDPNVIVASEGAELSEEEEEEEEEEGEEGEEEEEDDDEGGEKYTEDEDDSTASEDESEETISSLSDEDEDMDDQANGSEAGSSTYIPLRPTRTASGTELRKQARVQRDQEGRDEGRTTTTTRNREGDMTRRQRKNASTSSAVVLAYASSAAPAANAGSRSVIRMKSLPKIPNQEGTSTKVNDQGDTSNQSSLTSPSDVIDPSSPGGLGGSVRQNMWFLQTDIENTLQSALFKVHRTPLARHRVKAVQAAPVEGEPVEGAAVDGAAYGSYGLQWDPKQGSDPLLGLRVSPGKDKSSPMRFKLVAGPLKKEFTAASLGFK